MSRRRFRQTGQGSFYGDHVYERVVPKDHFLVQLKALVPWERFTQRLIAYYKGQAEYGPPPYDPALLLRMLLVSYLYNLSERQTEEVTTYQLAVKHFVGLAVDEPAPDHSLLTVFKERLLVGAGEQAYQGLMEEILQVAREAGIRFGSVQVIDSVHTVADVNVEKDRAREKRGQGSRDTDAGWGVKETRRVKREGGQVEKHKHYFYGYKRHTSYNVEAGMITSVLVTPGNKHDGQYLQPLVERDRAQGIEIGTVAADRAYDDQANHLYLQSHGIHSAIRLNDYRTQKKDPHKGPWLKLAADPWYQAGLKLRGRIERVFGEEKQGHGLARCRSVGKDAHLVQAYLTAMVVNLKRLVRTVTGVALKDEVKPAFLVRNA